MNPVATAFAPSNARIHKDNYDFLRDYIYRESGIVLDGDKLYLLEARLSPILRSRNLDSLNHLCTSLQSPMTELGLRQEVVEAMTTNETFFFRDPVQYDALKTFVLPPLIEQFRSVRPLRFWSAAASTGQEAYSLAMMLLEMGMSEGAFQILGTDLSEQVLDRARSGEYMQIEINRGLPAFLLIKHFTRAGLNWQLKDQVRRLAAFHKLDLRRTGSIGPFDVVFCRNVLIYFDVETRKRILRDLYDSLYGGGYLLLGGSESTLGVSDRFEPVTVGKAVIYRAL